MVNAMKSDKRTAILQAAKQLLLEVGYESMSPRMVLDRSNAGQGSFYHHFAGKKHLAKTVLEEIANEMIADLSSTFENDRLTPLEKLDHYLAKPRNGQQGCKLGRLANEKAFDDDELRQPLRRYFSFVLALVNKELEQAVEQGLMPADTPVDALAHLLVSAVQGGYVLSKSLADKASVNVATSGARTLLKAYQTDASQKAAIT